MFHKFFSSPLIEAFNYTREYDGFYESKTMKLDVITLFLLFLKPFVLKC